MGGAMIRATMSSGPPAGKGTTMVTLRLGQSWARAGSAHASKATTSAAIALTMAASIWRFRLY